MAQKRIVLYIILMIVLCSFQCYQAHPRGIIQINGQKVKIGKEIIISTETYDTLLSTASYYFGLPEHCTILEGEILFECDELTENDLRGFELNEEVTNCALEYLGKPCIVLNNLTDKNNKTSLSFEFYEQGEYSIFISCFINTFKEYTITVTEQ